MKLTKKQWGIVRTTNRIKILFRFLRLSRALKDNVYLCINSGYLVQYGGALKGVNDDE